MSRGAGPRLDPVRPLVPVCALVVAISVAGCSGSSGSPPSTPTSAATSASTSTPPSSSPSGAPSPTETTAPTATSTATATGSAAPTSAPAGGTACTTSSLRLSTGQGGAAAGTYYLPLVFTNVGTSPCRLRGYPGVSFVDANGHQLGFPAQRSRGERIRTLSLAVGGKAHANLGIPSTANFSDADCKPHKAAGIRAYPPGQTSSLFVRYRVTVCTTKNGRALIGPLKPGSQGS